MKYILVSGYFLSLLEHSRTHVSNVPNSISLILIPYRSFVTTISTICKSDMICMKIDVTGYSIEYLQSIFSKTRSHIKEEKQKGKKNVFYNSNQFCCESNQ